MAAKAAALIDALQEDDTEALDQLIDRFDATASQTTGTSSARDPWAELIRLELARLDAYREVDAARELARTTGERYVRPAMGDLIRRAGELAERWVDHPIGSYARLYQLSVYGDVATSSYDPHMLAPLAIDLLDSTADPMVAETAALLLANVGDRRLDLESDQLDVLRTADASDLRFPRPAIHAIAADAALRLEDDPRAAHWIDRWRQSIGALCSGTDAPLQWCETAHRSITSAESVLIARTDQVPSTWQAALASVARRCALEQPTELILRGTWTATGWSWEPAEGTDTERCIAAASHRGPAPPARTAVELVVLPAEQAGRGLTP